MFCYLIYILFISISESAGFYRLLRLNTANTARCTLSLSRRLILSLFLAWIWSIKALADLTYFYLTTFLQGVPCESLIRFEKIFDCSSLTKMQDHIECKFRAVTEGGAPGRTPSTVFSSEWRERNKIRSGWVEGYSGGASPPCRCSKRKRCFQDFK